MSATLKGLRGFAVNKTPGGTPSELRLRELVMRFPGLPNRNPGLELANAEADLVIVKVSRDNTGVVGSANSDVINGHEVR